MSTTPAPYTIPLPDPELMKTVDHRVEHVPPPASTVYSLSPVEHSDFRNGWAAIRHRLREPFAEFLGTLILIAFGTAVDCQVVLSSDPKVVPSPDGSYLSISFGWACGVALGVWVAVGVSGSHLNPAVSIALAVFRGFPWKKVPIYIAAQLSGAFIGSCLVYADYYHAIDIFEGGKRTIKGTGHLFGSFPVDYLSGGAAFYDEFFASAILLITLLSLLDKNNAAPPLNLLPIAVFILVLGLGVGLGMQTGYAVNPARDLGPRLMTFVMGYGKEVWTFRNWYWLWCPTIATILGALAGALVYDALIFTGPESILNTVTMSINNDQYQIDRDDKISRAGDNV